ncbi:hypothetical protein BT69DRAFT_1275828 [Atractiella rhizophila]|nr:hypothetical protein BT69DRAFT_1275828 [Atractiella rhizophila]
MTLVRHAIASRTIGEQLRSVFVKDGTLDALKQKAVDLSQEMEEVELKIMCLNLAWEKLAERRMMTEKRRRVVKKVILVMGGVEVKSSNLRYEAKLEDD